MDVYTAICHFLFGFLCSIVRIVCNRIDNIILAMWFAWCLFNIKFYWYLSFDVCLDFYLPSMHFLFHIVIVYDKHTYTTKTRRNFFSLFVVWRIQVGGNFVLSKWIIIFIFLTNNKKESIKDYLHCYFPLRLLTNALSSLVLYTRSLSHTLCLHTFGSYLHSASLCIHSFGSIEETKEFVCVCLFTFW